MEEEYIKYLTTAIKLELKMPHRVRILEIVLAILRKSQKENAT